MDATTFEKHKQPKQPEQADTRGSPAMRLYRHALESIFAMLQLEDLSRVLSVSRSWSAAVKSMKPIDAVIERIRWQWQTDSTARPLPPIDTLVTSPLLRHVAAIHIKIENEEGHVACTALTSESLALLAQHAPNLTSLWCELTLTPDAPLILPVKLSSLELEVDVKSTAADINGALTALAALPSLSRLCVRLFDNHDADLGLLAASRSLTDLTLEDHHGAHPPLRDAQVAQVRSSLGHLQRFNLNLLDRADVPRLLRPPHTLRWQEIGLVFVDACTGDLLVTLPTLTKLDLHYVDKAPHADFLPRLPLLSSLKLHSDWHIPDTPMLASLLPCIGLTELDLQCGFGSSQVSALLAALTNLRKLKLAVELDSLRCFTSGPVTQTLEELCIVRTQIPSFPLSELPHLYALQRLSCLQLEGVVCMDDASIAALSPPSAILPLLTRLSAEWITPDDEEDGLDRAGPSWAQSQQSQCS